MKEKRLPREFFMTDGLTLGKELLGKIMVHRTTLGLVRAVITETESYMGETDKGSHTYGGRRTERTEPMYHIGGTSYVYLIYGMYCCMNIAAGPEGIAQAVLIRSARPADEASEQIMLALRKGQKKHLADGPGKLCMAMEISRAQNDVDMVKSSDFYVTEGIPVSPKEIKCGKRINIDYAEEAADYLWRFYL